MDKTPAKLWLLIAVMTMARLVIASNTNLGNDEVYYWTYALDLQWNYFDHPPFVAWLIRATTVNLWLHHEAAVRFGAILSSGTGTWLIYRTGLLLRDERTGWYAALLYSASLYCSVIAGTFILPDSPQMVFWLWAILLLIKISKATEQNIPVFKLWCWFGFVTGLCILCKVHGIFLWAAVMITALFINRRLLQQSGMYISGIITLFIISPIIIWNIQHNFITYTYHGERVSLVNASFHPLGLIREIAGEIFYNNPFVFVLAWLSVLAAFKGSYDTIKQHTQILLACSLPLILILILLSAFKETLPHWSGPAYTYLILLSALKLSYNSSPRIPNIITVALLFFVFIISTGLIVVNFYPGSLSPEKDPMQAGIGDPTLDLYGWKKTGIIIDSIRKKDILSKEMPASAPIVITRWYPAAHLDFYAAPLTTQNTYAIGKIFDLHQYHWSNEQKLKKDDSAYYIVPSNLYSKRDADLVKSHFKYCSAALILPIYRNGKTAKNVILFKLKGYNTSANKKGL